MANTLTPKHKNRIRGEHAELEPTQRVQRATQRASTTVNHEARRRAAATTVDGSLESLEIFFREARTHALLTAADEIELAKRIERGDLAAKERMINANLRLVVSPGVAVSGPRAADGGPRPGGHVRPDPRGREVRLAARATGRCGSGGRFSAACRTTAGRSASRCTSSSASSSCASSSAS
jgi:Sigma-70 factor, region 1.2